MVTNTLGKLSPVKPMSSGQSMVQHLLPIFKGVLPGHRVGCWPPVFIVWEHGSWALEAFEDRDGLDVRGLGGSEELCGCCLGFNGGVEGSTA